MAKEHTCLYEIGVQCPFAKIDTQFIYGTNNPCSICRKYPKISELKEKETNYERTRR